MKGQPKLHILSVIYSLKFVKLWKLTVSVNAKRLPKWRIFSILCQFARVVSRKSSRFLHFTLLFWIILSTL